MRLVVFLGIMMSAAPVLAGYYGHRRFYRPRFPRHHHYHHYHYRGGDVFLGAMVGLALGAFLISPPPPRTVYVYRDYPPSVVYREYVYVPAPARVYKETRIYREPVRSSETVAVRAPSCLQTREYTTTIVIGGKEVPAYGTKCLQPDGSWSYGPAQPVPEF
ncbi:MAG: hypothetical protein JRI76_14205 [Deltaproteobacteria bacterium]|nr:hypothetical protein [Deltaproteobacteria bacterium]